MPEVRTITLPLPLRMGTVNCYLLGSEGSYCLIDTGGANGRAALEKELLAAGCRPGALRLVVLTHGDFDHIGNAVFLRTRYGAPLAMHRDDAGMAERGDMFWNRSSGNAILKHISPILFSFPRSKRFAPDWLIADGDSLADYGCDARVLALPGHSRGSIGVLTAGGDLFCGDLLENTKVPARNAIMDDAVACEASLQRLCDLGVATVYPGHGAPFPLARLRERTTPDRDPS